MKKIKISKNLFILFLTFKLVLISNLFSMAPKSTAIIDLSNKSLQDFGVNNLDHWWQECSSKKVTIETFTQIIKTFNNTSFQILDRTQNWQNNDHQECLSQLKKLNNHFCIFQGYSLFYSQKLILNHDDECFVFGDIHGNFEDFIMLIKDLIKENVLDHNLKLKDNKYLIFLGDYTDRGPYGLEVLTTVMLLKIINPLQVILIQGNHENLYINSVYGFYDELMLKFPENFHSALLPIKVAYELMPLALYLGHQNIYLSDTSQWALLNHGGVEVRYNPIDFLKNPNITFDLIELDYLSQKHPQTITDSYYKLAPLMGPKQAASSIDSPLYGFLWNDLIISENTGELTVLLSPRGNGAIQYNLPFLERIFEMFGLNENNIINLIIRGHQHNLPKILHNAGMETPSPGYAELRSDRLMALTLMSTTIISNQDTADTFVYHPTYLILTPPQIDIGSWLITSKIVA